ncbi:uncharacterized protein LOC121505629 isoform X2 [Cheilinus undulatus]|uniref:uncharacterized protein LOC121505629 isoform X2 n=1 Tax=Cheilinus undulatus TaxID=241271 RepID=UPI001BD6856F|nr:uncharacterized protein LOC121505629 isoform X2 [Cheilinus undulatus]
MNWVGGSRSRLVKNDAKKQREFFLRNRMQQKLKNLGIALPASTQSISSGSMDLVTLFIVNQIAAKKENKDPPKVAVLGSCGGGSSKHRRNEPLVLPMSPCSPSQLDLSGSQSSSVQGTRRGKHVIPQGFKRRQLSPVLESAFSDNSASDYLTSTADPMDPFSSFSLASPDQGRANTLSTGIFPLQQRDQAWTQLPSHCSPLPWDTSVMEQTKPFSQAIGETDSMPWSYGSSPPLHHLKTPQTAQVLFGSPAQCFTEATNYTEHKVTFSLNQAEDAEPMLDFTLNQSAAKLQFQEELFSGFNTEGCEGEACHVGRGKSKIYLRETLDNSSTPQTVPDSHGMEDSSRTGINCSCLQHDCPMNESDDSPNYSCAKSCFSSDSDDNEQCYHPCLPSSYMDQIYCEDSSNSNLPLQGNGHRRLPAPPLKSQINLGDNQKFMEYVVSSDKAAGSSSQQTGSSTPYFECLRGLGQTQSSELCKCKKNSRETRDVGTQTNEEPSAETCDASTQCSFVVHSAMKANKFNWCLPPFDVPVKDPATGRQSNTSSELNEHSPLSGNVRNDGRSMSWNNKGFRAVSLSDSNSVNTVPASNSDGKRILQGPRIPFLDALSVTDGKGKKRVGKDENGWLMTDPSNEVGEEVTSATKVNKLLEETETLQETADILLQLKRRKDEEQ